MSATLHRTRYLKAGGEQLVPRDVCALIGSIAVTMLAMITAGFWASAQ